MNKNKKIYLLCQLILSDINEIKWDQVKLGLMKKVGSNLPKNKSYFNMNSNIRFFPKILAAIHIDSHLFRETSATKLIL